MPPPESAPELGPLAVLLLALVQGLTEFLPVSSSGHLVLAQALLGLTRDGLALDVALHVGTLLAVVAFYRRDLRRLAGEALAGSWRELGLLAAGSLPAAAVGLGFGGFFSRLFHSPVAAGAGLCATAGILAWGERARRRSERVPVPPEHLAAPRDVGLADALWIGAGQALAIFPGVSRSGTTIAVGLRRGLKPEVAARFSFLLSVPVIGGAALLELPAAFEHGFEGMGSGVVLAAVGVAAVVGWGALAVLIGTLRRGAFVWFAAYCAAVGAVALGLSLRGG